MKKIFIISVFISLVIPAFAQRSVQNYMKADSLLPRWCIDINFKAGMMTQNLTTVDFRSAFQNVLNDTIGKPKFNNGTSIGFDVQGAYFFGRKRHFGIGTGFMYLSQKGDFTLDQYRLEYKSLDNQNDTFRQIVTSNGQIKETVTINNFTIPLMFKYKDQFSYRWGIAVDAGLLFNLQMTNSYTTNAAFDYEAIYKYQQVGNTIVPVYDYAATPGTNDWYITRQEYGKDAPTGNVQTYFSNEKAQGYNVGLGQAPSNTSGSVKYKGTIGFLIQPSLSFRVTDYFFLHLGFYYMMQQFDNSSNTTNYMLTNKVGDYSSVMNSISKSSVTSYGLNLGARIYLDRDMFGHGNGHNRGGRTRPEYKPMPETPPVVKTQPKRAPVVIDDYKPVVREEVKEEPIKPTAPFSRRNVFFATNESSLSDEAKLTLDSVAKYMQENPLARLNIIGHADNRGAETTNLKLSDERADAVRKYVEAKGIKLERLNAIGLGDKYPAANNSTEEGRSQNRRVSIELRLSNVK